MDRETGPRSAAASPRLGTLLVWIGFGALVGAQVGPAGLWAPTLAVGVGSLITALGLGMGRGVGRRAGPLLGLLSALSASARAEPPPVAVGEATLVGVVSQTRSAREVWLDVRSARDPSERDVSVDRVILATPAELGEVLEVRATLSPLQPFRNRSPHPNYRGGARYARGSEVTVLTRRPLEGLERWLVEARASVRRSIRASTSADVEGLVVALVLGDSSLDPEDARAARDSGLSHVVAVSGMHVTFVVGAFVSCLAWLARRSEGLARRVDARRLAYLVGALVAPLYAAFAGGSPSAYRAAATASVAWLLAASGRRASALSVTGFVVVAGAVFTEDALRSPAFVLSVLATAAVLEPGEGALDDLEAGSTRFVRSLVRSALRASLATAPFTLYCFGTLPPLSVLANVVVVPVVAALLLPLGTLHALVSILSIDLARALAPLTEGVVRAFLALSRFFADAGRSLSIPPLDAAELAIVAVVVGLLLLVRRKRDALLVLALGALAFTAAELRLRDRERGLGALRVSFLDVGQGDAALVDFPDGQAWLVDTGGASFGAARDPGREVIVPLLRARRRRYLDGVIITHPHPDHWGGFAALAASIPIHELWDSGQAAEEDPDGAWVRSYAGLLVPLRTPEELCGAPRDHGGARVEVLSPCPRFDPAFDANDNSLVVRISYGRRSFLLMGDAEAHAEARLAPSLSEVDVLKVGHHGSRTSSTEAFARAVAPGLAVISSGASNRFGHPHAEVLGRWSAHAEVTLRTDREGSVEAWTDGERLEVTTFSGRRFEVPRRAPSAR